MKRRRVSSKRSKRMFSATAARTRKKNLRSPMRGGIRL